MNTCRFKTNVKCNGCIAAITPHLNRLKGLISWRVDLADPQRILTAEVSGIAPDEIISALQKAGYLAELLEIR